MAAQDGGVGGLDQSGNSGSRHNWPDLEFPLKVEPLEFPNRLDVRLEIEGGIQAGSRVLAWTTKWKLLPWTEMEEMGEGESRMVWEARVLFWTHEAWANKEHSVGHAE